MTTQIIKQLGSRIFFKERLLMFAIIAWFVLAMTGTAAVSNQVAVLDFKLENPAANLNERVAGLEDFFEVALQKHDVPVLERRNIRLVLAERALQNDGLTAEALSQAGLPSVDFFLDGHVSFLSGDEFTLTVSIIRADKSTVEGSFIQRGVYPTEWLSTIDSVAKEVSGRLRVALPPTSMRTPSESLTWLPEAALPFFKGLEYYARGDLPQAAGWFRTASGKDPRFDQARLWEARALRQIGFPELADFALAMVRNKAAIVRTNAPTRPVLAVIATENVSASCRVAFENTLARSGRYEIFEPQAIGATAREIDLQLTGQMIAPLNARSVWLVVDNLIFLEATNGELCARQSDLLSGQVLRQVKVTARGVEERRFIQLATVLLKSLPKNDTETAATDFTKNIVEPAVGDLPEAVFGKVLRLAKAQPDEARPWVALADFYSPYSESIPKLLLLNRAIAAIERNPNQTNAPFWLTSALWRKRYVSRLEIFQPGTHPLRENPLTNDFALLLNLFPDSQEARTLSEWTIKAGAFTYSLPGKMDFLYGGVYGGGGTDVSAQVGNGKSPAPVSADEWLARLERHRELGENAKAWMQANWDVPKLAPEAQDKLNRIKAELLPMANRDDEQFKLFTNTVALGESERALEQGQALLHCLFRAQRLTVVEQCASLVKARYGVEAQINFLVAQMERYKDDFNLDPATGAPRTETVDCQFAANARAPFSWANATPDLSYARVLGNAIGCDRLGGEMTSGNLECDAKIFEALRANEALPIRNRLTASYDLARTRYNQGRYYETTELVRELLRQTESADSTGARGNSWGVGGLQSSSLHLLKEVRLLADPEMDFSDCSGELPRPPLPKPANIEEMNRWLAELWSHIQDDAAADKHLLERRAEVMPTILYNLQQHQNAQQMLTFCGMLGTNAISALPFVTHYVCWADPFPYVIHGTALMALSAFGKQAASALPVLIIASEGTDYTENVKAALSCVGVAPRRSLPYLARLLDHKSITVEEKAAKAIVKTSRLKGPLFDGKSGEQLISAVRNWWEQTGIQTDWSKE